MGFAGGLHDPDTGLVRFGFRDYDPDTGRFTALDPLGYAAGDPDLYGYCLDDPVNLVDPEGLFFIDEIIAKQAAGGTSDMLENYLEMREANTKGTDKYYHCKANCEATKRGPGGQAAAWGISEIREAYGRIKGDPESDSMKDKEANAYGRGVSGGQSCEDRCSIYLPKPR